MKASPSGLVRHWRAGAAALLCAAGGAGLRMALREGGAQAPQQTSGRAQAETAAGVWEKETTSGKTPPPPRLTVEQLLELPSGDRLLAVLELLPALTADEVSALVHAQFGIGGSGNARITDADVAEGYLSALFTRWAETDPDGMVLALEAPGLMYELEARRRAVQAWAEARGVAAVEATWKKWPRLAQEAAWQVLSRDPGSMETLLPWLKDSLGEGGVEYTSSAEKVIRLLGPERAVVLMAAAGNERALDYVLSAIAQENFPRALAAVKALPAGGVREQALQDILVELDNRAGLDSSGGLQREFMQEFEALPPGRTRDALTDEYASLLAAESPDKALEWARTQPAGETRRSALSAAGYALEAANNWEAATKVFAEARNANPPAVYELSATFNYSYRGHFDLGYPVGRTFSKWHEEDPAAAMAWLQSQTDRGLRSEALQNVVAQGGASLSLIPDSAERIALATESLRMASEPREKDRPVHPPLQLTPDVERLARLRLLTLDDSTWASMSVEERRLLSEDAMASFSSLAPQAIDRFNNMAPEERSLGAWYYAGQAQAEMDMGAASEWMDTLPPGPERDAAATALVERLTADGDDRDGEAAFAWAASMSGDEERRRYIEQAAKVWAEQDLEAAMKAVIASGLPAEEVVPLAEELKKGGAR